MRLRLATTFACSARWTAPLPPLDLTRAGRLDFEPPDTRRFPCLALAFRALEGDPALPIVLNAANEVAVAGFLEGRLAFPAIGELICRAMDAFEADGSRPVETLQDVRAVDSWARAFASRQTTGVH